MSTHCSIEFTKKALSEISSFGIGGEARYFCEIKDAMEAKQAVRFIREKNLKFMVLGKGSNCLFDDSGFDGLIVLNKIDFLRQHENEIWVGSGFHFSLLGARMSRQHLKGLEFASGIPGTVGGAVFMNAGANGMETRQTLKSVEYLDKHGDIHWLEKDELDFGYRSSSFHHLDGMILSAKFELTPCDDVKERQREIVDYRMKTQPYKDKSAGCIFRNPESTSAGSLIEACGLKGYRIGGAEVSTMHGNFIVNKDQASSADVLSLIDHVQKKVYEQTGQKLELEVRYIPNA